MADQAAVVDVSPIERETHVRATIVENHRRLMMVTSCGMSACTGSDLSTPALASVPGQILALTDDQLEQFVREWLALPIGA